MLTDFFPQLIENLRFCQNTIKQLSCRTVLPLSLIEGYSFWQPGKTLLGKYLLVHHLNPKPHEIFCSSIRSAKGLEFPVVILTELYSSAINQEILNYAPQLYTGVSRARSHLIIISKTEDFEHLWREN